MKIGSLRIAVVAVVLACSLAGAFSPVVNAEDQLADACTGAAAQQSATCKSLSPNNNPLTGTDGLLYRASVFLASIAGVVAVVVALISGFRYITSAGDAQKAATARKTLIGAIIGLIIIALAQTIITFIIRKL